ncbi:MAG: sigma factor [Verrucomicrobiota bacterium]
MTDLEKRRDYFATTRWTVVLTAARTDTTRARKALAELCQVYWYPLYAYARRRGHSVHDAEDLTQGFFAHLLQQDFLAGLSQEKGRFRAFLLASMNHYMADEWDRVSAQKREAKKTLSLEAETAEHRYQTELAEQWTPERVFERQWAMILLETTVQRLAREYETAGRGALFTEIQFAILGERSAVPYTELAARLNLSHEAVRVAVHRLRQRYRRILREEIAHTVTGETDILEELNYLRQVLAS